MNKKILSCLVTLMTICVSYAQNHQLWVGESLTCDISSAVMGTVTDMNWSSSGGYISLTGSGFYRDAQVTQYFSGTATVTCSWYYTLYYGGSRTRMSKTWTIACLDNPAKLVPTSMTMVTGGVTRKVSCTLTYTNSYSSYANIYYQSSNPSIATVDQYTGVVTPISAGTTYITAYSNVSANSPYCTVTVTSGSEPTSISITESSLSLEEGETRDLTYTLSPSTATTTVTWSSSNTSVATVNSSGKVTAVSAGTATITAKTSNNKTATCSVTVTAATLNQPTSVTFSRSSMSLEVGNTATLTPIFYPAGTTAPLIWGSLDESVATVNNGVVTALKEGLTYIGAYNTSLEIEAVCEVTVTDPNSTLPTSISLSPTSMNLTVGEYKYIYESFYPEGTTADITWSSNKTSVATVNSYGKVTAVSAGSATITAKTSNNKTATCSVTVTDASTQPTSISVSPSYVNLEVGGTKNLTYTLSPSTATTTVTWSSSNTSVATVSSAGKVTAVSAGSATITAKTSNNKTATCAVTVQASPSVISPTGITIVPEHLILKVGGSKTLSYLLTPINATTTVTWESDDPSVATVSSTGYVKAKGEGLAIITARTSNNETATCYVEVFTSSNYTLIYEYDEYSAEATLLYIDGDPVGSITIPSYVTNPDDNKRYKVVGIGDWAFEREYGITAITLPTTITSIGFSAFYNCASLTSLTIPNGVTSIGDNAFYGCSSLTSIKIGSSVTSIGVGAFENCYSLTSVTIPNSVTNIGYRAFDGCSSLTSVTIPNSVTSIGDNAFSGCSSLTSINVANGNLDYCSTEGVLFNKAQTRLIQYPAGKSNVTYTIPNSVTSIGFSAFYNCASLTSLTIPNGVTSIGMEAFSGCTGLTSLNISDIAAWCAIRFGSGTANPLCFAHNLYLNDTLVTDLVIPNSVTSIEKYAFYNCRSMSSVSIPNSVTNIGNSAFSGCSSLTSVTNNAITPQSVDASTFYNVNKSACTLYVPKESVDLYNVADEWKDFGNIIGLKIPQGIENIQGNDVQCTKVLRDGQIYILRGDKIYTLQGQEVK